MENQVETQEIWVPCAPENSQAIRFEDGQNLMLAAIIANGHPIFLANGIALEKVWRPEEHLKKMERRNTTPHTEEKEN